MDPVYFSAFAALAGSAIGGLASLGASWLTQHTQVRAQQLTRDIARREELYKNFIEEASKLYADALEHDTADTSKLVALYALVSRMRMLSSPPVVEKADREIDLLRDFGEACREELRSVAGRSVNVRVELPFEQEVNPFVGEVYEHKAFSRQLPQVRKVHRAPLVVVGGCRPSRGFCARLCVSPGSPWPIPEHRDPAVHWQREGNRGDSSASRELRQQTMRAAAPDR